MPEEDRSIGFRLIVHVTNQPYRQENIEKVICAMEVNPSFQ